MKEFLKGRVAVKVGDITQEKVDAVVNAANGTLMGGGGVDGAIHRAGGPSILEECKKIRATDYPDGLPDGEAVVTTGGKLPAKFVIHTVGPVWGGGKRREDEKLRNCYLNSLQSAVEKKCKTVAFPAISTGVYRFPKDGAAKIASAAVAEFLETHSEIQKVRMVFFSEEDAETFLQHCQFG